MPWRGSYRGSRRPFRSRRPTVKRYKKPSYSRFTRRTARPTFVRRKWTKKNTAKPYVSEITTANNSNNDRRTRIAMHNGEVLLRNMKLDGYFTRSRSMSSKWGQFVNIEATTPTWPNTPVKLQLFPRYYPDSTSNIRLISNETVDFPIDGSSSRFYPSAGGQVLPVWPEKLVWGLFGRVYKDCPTSEQNRFKFRTGEPRCVISL